MNESTNVKNVVNVKDTNLDDLLNLLNQICLQAAQHFSLYDQYGKPRKSAVLEAIAKSPCLTCITERLARINIDVDSLYKECHRLAVDVLVEELYHFLNQMGFKVFISTEAELEYGKVDVLITVTNYGLSLKNSVKELLVEVKTGNSLSLTQIFRYLMDSRSDTIIVWRIRRRQVLVFDVHEVKPLLTEFVRMLCLRGIRLLSAEHIQPCQHERERCHQPKQNELEQMFRDFSKALIETLPSILQIITEKLGISTLQLNEDARINEKDSPDSQGDANV
jgi:hypothetical protein